MDRIWQYTEIQWNIDSHIRWLKSEMAFQEINWIQSLLAANFHELGGIYGNEFWFLVFILVGMTLSWVGRCMSPLDVNVKWKKTTNKQQAIKPVSTDAGSFFPTTDPTSQIQVMFHGWNNIVCWLGHTDAGNPQKNSDRTGQVVQNMYMCT